MDHPPNSRRCAICASALPQASPLPTVCARSACRAALARRHAEAFEEARTAADQKLRAQIAARLGLKVPEDFPVQRLRVQRGALVRQSNARMARLRAHLLAITAEAFATPDERANSAIDASAALSGTRRVPVSKALDDACGAACSLCKGDCCLTGEESLAYLTADTIRKKLKDRPKATSEDFVAEYMSFVPIRATEDGCFYQAGRGCTLPRDLRSDVCNRYFCDELQRFRAEMRAPQAESVQSNNVDLAVRAFFVVTLPNGRRQTRFFEAPTS